MLYGARRLMEILGYPLPFTIEFLLETQNDQQEGKGSHGKP
jgi:hypothetical protein